MLLGDANICGLLLGRQTPCGRALEDERAERRAIVRVHILDPVAVAIYSRVQSVFLAIWRRGAGRVTVTLYIDRVPFRYLVKIDVQE